jgi:trimeric autotransporter adhesin
MSKLIEALKRAEELRKQKRLQIEAAASSASTAPAPVNEIEAALIAEEARMAAKRVLELYEEEKSKSAVLPTPHPQPISIPITTNVEIATGNIHNIQLASAATTDDAARALVEAKIATEEAALAAVLTQTSPNVADIAATQRQEVEARLAALVTQREAAEENLRQIVDARAKAEDTALQLADELAQREQEATVLNAGLAERIEEETRLFADAQLRLAALESERDAAVLALQEVETQHADKAKITAEKSADLDRKMRLALEVKEATVSSMAALVAAAEKAQAERAAAQKTRLAALDDINVERNLLDQGALTAYAKREAAETKVAASIDARIKAEEAAIAAAKSRIDADAQLERAAAERHEAESAALAIAEANIERENALTKLALDHAMADAAAKEKAAASIAELQAARVLLDRDIAAEIEQRQQLLTLEANAEKTRLSQLDELTAKRAAAEKSAAEARALRQTLQTKLEEETRNRIAAEDAALSAAVADKHAEDELTQAINEKRDAEIKAAASATEVESHAHASIARLLADTKRVAEETAQIHQRIETNAAQIKAGEAEELTRAEAALAEAHAQRDAIAAKQKALQDSAAQFEMDKAHAKTAMLEAEANAANQLAILESKRLDMEAMWAAETQLRQRAEDEAREATVSRIAAEHQLAEAADAKLAQEQDFTRQQQQLAASENSARETIEASLAIAKSIAATSAELNTQLTHDTAQFALTQQAELARADAARADAQAELDAVVAKQKSLLDANAALEAQRAADIANSDAVMLAAKEAGAEKLAQIKAARIDIEAKWASAAETRQRAEADAHAVTEARIAAEQQLIDAANARLIEENEFADAQNRLAAIERDSKNAAAEKIRAELTLNETLAAKTLALNEAIAARLTEAKRLQDEAEAIQQQTHEEALALAEAKAEIERIRDAEPNPILRMQLPEVKSPAASETKSRQFYWLTAASICFTALGFYAATLWHTSTTPSDANAEYNARDAVLARAARDVAQRDLTSAVNKADVLDEPLRLKIETSLRANPASQRQLPKE